MIRTFRKGEKILRTDKNTVELSRIDYLILSTLLSNNATSAMVGLTIKELDITDVVRSTIWKHINFMIGNNLICQSGTYGRQKMYYITECGIKMIGGN